MRLIGYSSDDLFIKPKKKIAEANAICCYCDIRLNKRNYSREHIVPKSKGGKETIPACKGCNGLRNNRTFSEFREVVLYHGFGTVKTLTIINNIDNLIKKYGDV